MQCMIENRGLFMENNIKEESRLKFQFAENDTVIKFDDTKFYRDYFNKLPEAKGVDFISVAKDKIAFIEVKNCTGDEGNNRWRIAPDNRKRNTTHTSVDVEGRDSLDIEMAQKTAMTIAALVGAKSFGNAIHQSGKWYTNENIDMMLMERHLNKKARRGSNKNYIKGPKKRTEEDDVRFAQSFEKLILMAKSKEGAQSGTI